MTGKSLVQDWLNAYEQYGIDGLNHKSMKQKYTGEYILRVIQCRQINRLSYRNLCKALELKHITYNGLVIDLSNYLTSNFRAIKYSLISFC